MKKIPTSSIDHFLEHGIYIPTRTIYMGSEHVTEDGSESGTDAKMTERIVKNLHLLDSVSSEPITIIMNNLGGDSYHGMAIYDAIKACRSHVTIIAIGHVMSMGSIIFQAADRRLMAPNAIMMIHWGHEYVGGDPKTVRRWTAFNKKYGQIMANILLARIKNKHPTFTRKKLDKLLDFDTILLANDVVALGLADIIYHGEEKKAE